MPRFHLATNALSVWLLALVMLPVLSSAEFDSPACAQEVANRTLQDDEPAETPVAGAEDLEVIDDSDFAPDQSEIPVPCPADGAVLFDGASGINLFRSKDGSATDWTVDDEALTVTIGESNHVVSMLHFRDADIHVEFMTTDEKNCNSGIYIHGNYELQIMNSVDKEISQEIVGAVYGFHPPLVNADRGPGEWQVFDIRYRAPVRDVAGGIRREGSVTAWLNGQQVQLNARVGEPRSTYHPFRYRTTDFLTTIGEHQKATSTGPVFLQDHAHEVKFRNVWVRPLDDAAFFYGDALAEGGFEPLFDGEAIPGDWIIRNGRAPYEVIHGALVGTCVPGEPNSFLCPPADYSDFILETEFKVDDAMNSGIQIRSHAFDGETEFAKADGSTGKIAAGRVHGYQVEIDPSDRAFSGGIYDEARRGWLFELADNPAARAAFRHHAWNHFRIECRGNHIQTWINGVAAADLEDDLTASGFIGFQVHGANGREEMHGSQVSWRNVRIKVLEDDAESK